MTDVNNIDGILVPREQAMLANEQIPAQPVQEIVEPQKEQETAEIVETPVTEPEIAETEAPKTDDKPETKAESPIDEYGNPVEKPKMYSEEEVQRMIRDRLSRGRHAEQPSHQQVQQMAQDFKADPNSEESWENQLKTFVKQTLKEVSNEEREIQWRQQEKQKQAQFEERFTSGMSKYSDFNQIVADKPITDKIMMATRALENPAAFIYGASKLHPQELDRIARIEDPYILAAEVGRLHERMVKARNAQSKAGKPLEAPKGDVPVKQMNDYGSLESRIEQHAKQKRIR